MLTVTTPMLPLLKLAGLLATFQFVPCSVSNGAYVFTMVADSSSLAGGLNNIDVLPQLNNNNQVALLFLNSSNGIQGGITNATSVNIWSAGTRTEIASSTFTAGHYSRPAISDSGKLAFRNSTGVFRGDASGLQTLFTDTNLLHRVRINGGDRVVTSTKSSLSAPILVQSKVSSSTTIHASDANSTGQFSSYLSGGAPSPDINDAGNVVLRGALRSTGRDGIYLATSLGIETIADTSNGFASFSNIADVNNNNQVAFLGRANSDPAGTRSVYVGGLGQSPTLYANRADFTSISDAGPAMNDSGLVMFNATANSSSAIFSGGNPMTDRIIGTGDSLNGSTIASVVFSQGMLNNAGNFVFYATLDSNGDQIADRSAVFFAQLTAVPEPSLLLALLITVGGTVFAPLRKRVTRRLTPVSFNSEEPAHTALNV